MEIKGNLQYDVTRVSENFFHKKWWTVRVKIKFQNLYPLTEEFKTSVSHVKRWVLISYLQIHKLYFVLKYSKIDLLEIAEGNLKKIE